MFTAAPRIVLLAALCVMPLAYGASAAAGPAVRQEAEKPKSELAKLMGKINRHMKSLKSNVAKADKKKANVADFGGIADLAEKCKAHPPETAKTEDDKKKFADMLDGVAAAGKDGAKASEAGDIAGAKKAYAALKRLKADGHEKFIPADK